MKVAMEITHPAHPKHNLVLDYTETPFDCHGCEEAGIGLKYKCHDCEYELHKVCGAAQPTMTPPFFEECEFDFYYLPPGCIQRSCDACGDDIRGFVYHDAHRGLDLHPCCANLPQVLDDGKQFLYLYKQISGPCHHCGGGGGGGGSGRGRSGKKGRRRGWAYSSQCRGYNLHISCAKKLLVEAWLATYFNVDRNRLRELHTRIPTLNGSPRYLAGARDKGSIITYLNLAGGAARLVLAAILGDPTAIIAGVVQGFITQ